MPTSLMTAARAGGDPEERQPLPRTTALARGLLGWLVLCVGLGLAVGLTLVLKQRAGVTGPLGYLVQAVLMSLLVVPTVLLVRRRLDRRSVAGLGFGRRAGRPLLIGVGAGLASGALVWVPAALAGWVRPDGLDLEAFGSFLLVNGVALLLFEALPEELALRGYLWTNVRDGWGPLTATLVTTALFPFGSGVSTAVTAATTGALGTRRAPLEASPETRSSTSCSSCSSGSRWLPPVRSRSRVRCGWPSASTGRSSPSPGRWWADSAGSPPAST